MTPSSQTATVGDTVEFNCSIKNSANTTVFVQGWQFYINQDSTNYHLRFGNIYGDNSIG